MGLAATYLNINQFAVSGDYTPYILEDQAVLCDCGVDGDKKRIVTGTGFAAGATTVTLKVDGARNLTVNLAEIEWSKVDPGTAASIPLHAHVDDDDGGAVVATPSAHAGTHERAGADEVDGDHLDIDWDPTNYTPATTPAEAASVDDLTAHLYGIDQALSGGGGGSEIEDADGDTKVQVEEGADDDTIRFDTAGNERAAITPSGVVVIGGGTTFASTDPVFAVVRNATVAGNGHCFVDESEINKSGVIGYNSFDSIPEIIGSHNYDHVAGVQSRPYFHSIGMIARLMGFTSLIESDGGLINEAIHYCCKDLKGAGSATTQYGFYVKEALTQAATNWAFYSVGATPSYLGGNLHIGNGAELRFYDVGESNYVGFKAPTLTANQIWVLPDEDGNAGQMLITDGNGVLSWQSVMDTKSVTIENPGSSEDITMFFTPEAITISEMRAVLRGSSTPSVTWTIRHATDRNAAGNEVVTGGTTTTSITTGSDVTIFDDATIPADSFVWIETTAQSGTVDELHLTIKY